MHSLDSKNDKLINPQVFLEAIEIKKNLLADSSEVQIMLASKIIRAQ